MSGALTLLDNLAKLKPTMAVKQTLVIHVAGASIYEMMGLIKWECKYIVNILLIMMIKSFISSVVIRLRYKFPDKSTTSYDMLDFGSDIENL